MDDRVLKEIEEILDYLVLKVLEAHPVQMVYQVQSDHQEWPVYLVLPVNQVRLARQDHRVLQEILV